MEADARDLSRWTDGSFDAVVALGPMYHLPDPAHRAAAGSEIARVLRPGGVAFVAFMTWMSFLRRTLSAPDERHHLGDPGFVAALRDHGQFNNDVQGRFTQGYGERPAELAPFFANLGLQNIATVSAQGFATGIEDTLEASRHDDPAAYDATLAPLVETASDPSLLGLAAHIVHVAQLPLR